MMDLRIVDPQENAADAPENQTIWYRVHFRDDTTALVQLRPSQTREAVRIGRRKVVAFERAKIHTCTICQTDGPWSDGWRWYGSYLDGDEGRDVLKICSDACLDAGVASGMLPHPVHEIEGD